MSFTFKRGCVREQLIHAALRKPLGEVVVVDVNNTSLRRLLEALVPILRSSDFQKTFSSELDLAVREAAHCPHHLLPERPVRHHGKTKFLQLFLEFLMEGKHFTESSSSFHVEGKDHLRAHL